MTAYSRHYAGRPSVLSPVVAGTRRPKDQDIFVFTLMRFAQVKVP